ncbi:MAG: hypothetical protein ACREON_05775 [Gemmatimonadaceae bacterium]
MRKTDLTILFRAFGAAEYALLVRNGFTAFPEQLPHQPIFCPAATEEYASEIARDWNARDAASGYVGYVARFAVRSEHLTRFPLQTVGPGKREYRVPAKHVPEFNRNIVGLIEVVAEFRAAHRARAAE